MYKNSTIDYVFLIWNFVSSVVSQRYSLESVHSLFGKKSPCSRAQTTANSHIIFQQSSYCNKQSCGLAYRYIAKAFIPQSLEPLHVLGTQFDFCCLDVLCDSWWSYRFWYHHHASVKSKGNADLFKHHDNNMMTVIQYIKLCRFEYLCNRGSSFLGNLLDDRIIQHFRFFSTQKWTPWIA